MTKIYVAHCGPIIVGPPKTTDNVDPFLTSIREVKVEPLDKFLANLNQEEKTLLSNGVITKNNLLWGGRAFAYHSIYAEEIRKIIAPMVKEGKIPDDLNFVDIQHRLGIPTREILELAIFELLKDVGEQSIAWTDSRSFYN